MPATTVARLWNVGRRAGAFLCCVALPLMSQSSERAASSTQGRPFTQIVLEAVDATVTTTLAERLVGTAHRLVWKTTADGIQRISVSAPRAPGLWLRVSGEDEDHASWRFVTLETGRSRDLLFGISTPSGAFRLHYEFNGTAVRRGLLPVIFTLTEG